MSQYPYNEADAWRDADPTMGDIPQARTSKLAVATFICGLLPCLACAPSLLGVVFGLIAIPRISTSGGRLKGMGWAGAGLLLCLLALFLAFWLGNFGYKMLGKPAAVGSAFLHEVESAVDPARAVDMVHVDANIDESQINTLREDLQRRYGSFLGATIDLVNVGNPDSPLNTQPSRDGRLLVMQAPVLLQFTSQDVPALVVIVLSGPAMREAELVSITFSPGTADSWNFPLNPPDLIGPGPTPIITFPQPGTTPNQQPQAPEPPAAEGTQPVGPSGGDGG